MEGGRASGLIVEMRRRGSVTEDGNNQESEFKSDGERVFSWRGFLSTTMTILRRQRRQPNGEDGTDGARVRQRMTGQEPDSDERAGGWERVTVNGCCPTTS